MERETKIKFYITELFLQVQESKKALVLYDELSKHLLYAPNTRNMLMDVLFENAILRIACIIKNNSDSICIHKILNILENKQDISSLKSEVGDRAIKEVTNAIHEFEDSFSNSNELKSIISWRDQYYAHLDKKWYGGALDAAKIGVSTYYCKTMVCVLEELFLYIYKKLNWKIPQECLDEDIERFIEIIKLGENALN